MGNKRLFVLLGVFLFVLVSWVGADCPLGMVAYWKLDASPRVHLGTVVDHFGNGNMGTFYTNEGAINKAVTGKLGYALSFDGIDDHISVPNKASLNPTNQITVMAWINPAADNNNMGVIVKKSDNNQKNGYALATSSHVTNQKNTFRFGIYDGKCIENSDLAIPTGWCVTGSTPPLTTGEWYHLAATYDGSNLNFYLNGNLISTLYSVSGSIIPSSNSLMVGKDPSNPSATIRFFKGRIDEVAVYNRALTEEEIRGLYNIGIGRDYCECECFSGECCDDCFFRTSDYECRAKQKDCDKAEYCTGASPDCPIDSLDLFGTQCSNGACDSFGNCLDCDTSEEICSSSGCGNLNFLGDKCCGDDVNEYYNYRRGEVEDINDVACCGSLKECVYGGQCYSEGMWQVNGEARYCSNGGWSINLVEKCDWNNENCGYCDVDSKCITPQKECIDDGDFVEDHLCENGEWTSRTKIIALQLLEIAGQIDPDDYTLFCDDYEDTLNYYDYLIAGIPVIEGLKETNNFCVLKLPEQVIFGTSLNMPIDEGSFIDTLTGVGDCNNALGINDGKFHQCSSGSSKAWYNDKIQSVIYSNRDILDNPSEFEVDAWEAFLTFLRNPFQKIFNFLMALIEEEQGLNVQDYEFITGVKDFSRIYLDKKYIRSIKGIIEKVTKPKKGEYFSVTYAMYNEDVCSTVNAAFERLNPSKKDLVLCYYDALSRSYYVVSNASAALALWPDLTAKLRTRPPVVVPMQYCYVREESCESGENSILSLSSVVDAHASKEGEGGFTYKLCCRDYELDDSCSQEEIVRLSSEEDAHANAPDIDLFEERVCIKAEEPTEVVICESVLYPGGCYPDETCVVSLSDIADAHLSSCEDTQFSVRICCKVEETTTQTCTDSDGGDNKWEKGYLTINGEKYGEEFCYTQEQGDLYGSVGESFCINNGKGTSTSNPRECPNGCEDGACICAANPCDDGTLPDCEIMGEECICEACPEQPACTDSDGGMDYYVKGSCEDDKGGQVSDGCIVGGEHDGWLREVACGDLGEGLQCLLYDYQCPNGGCQDGACI